MGRADDRRARKRGGARRGKRAKPKRARPKSGGIARFFGWKRVLGGFIGLCALGIGAFFVLYLLVDVPDANAQAEMQSNTYSYGDGSLIARTGQVNREVVPIAEIPKDVQHAFVAAENKTFYDDAGVDLMGTTRGLLSTVTGRKQGGSTITQQYVKNYFLTQEQTVTRKAKELIISLKVDRERSKDEILAGYMNTSYYGRGAYGIQAAARAYYDVDVGDLTVEQGAYLAALLQAPSQYDWTAATETGRKLVLQRWRYVLNNMVEMDWLDGSERDGMEFPEPGGPKPAPGLDGQTGYLVKAAEQELIDAGVSEQELAAGGWNITLGIDRKKQRALEKSVDKTLTKDLDPKKRKVDGDVQAGAVSVDPETGRVVALYGGEDYFKHYLSNATRRDYQPASTFKPLILAAALENDATTQDGAPITPSTIYDGTSKRAVRGSATGFAPPNEDDIDYGPVSVQRAMNKSVNSVFAQMAVDVGLEETKETALELGMSPKAGGFVVRPAMSLGVMGASPMDMAGVYATLDNHGEKVTPRLVKSAERGTQKPDLPEAVGGQVVDRTTADTVTSVLTGVVDDGTAKVVRSDKLNIAGKTGTSDDNKSAWFAGYTPDLVTAVGLFGESAKEGKQVTLKGAGGGGRVNGGGYPAEIWAAYNELALGGKTAARFDLDTDRDIPAPSTSAPEPEVSETESEPEPSQTSESEEPEPDPTSTTPSAPPSSSAPPTTSSPPPDPDPSGEEDGDEPQLGGEGL